MVKSTKRNVNNKNKKSVKRRSKKAGFNYPNVKSFSNSPYHHDYHKNREKIPYEFKKEDYKFRRTLSDITGFYSDAGKVKRILKDFNSDKKSTNEADLSTNWLNSGIPRKYSEEQKLKISEDTKNLLEHLKTNYPNNDTLKYISETVKYTNDSTGGRKRKTKKSRKSRRTRRR